MKLLTFLCLLIALLCCQPPSHAEQSSSLSEPFITIAEKRITPARLDSALAQLPKQTTESPGFWNRIANDKGYSLYHRRRAITQLFKRHFHTGMRVGNLAAVLDHPRWLNENDTHVVINPFGFIPARGNPNDIVFSLTVLPKSKRDVVTIYFRIDGRLDIEGFTNTLRGIKIRRMEDTKIPIAEIGFYDPSMIRL